MNKTYIITGPPGSGKSTISSYLAAQFELGIHIHCDDIYNMVKGGYLYPWDDKDNFLMGTMLESASEIQKVYSSKGFNCVIDYVLHLEQLKSLIANINSNVSLTILLPDDETNAERDASREFTIGKERVSFYNNYFKKMSSSISSFVIDNSNLKVEELGQMILSRHTYSTDELLVLL